MADIGHGGVEVVDFGEESLGLARPDDAGGAGQHQTQREDFPEQLVEQQFGWSGVSLCSRASERERCSHLETPSLRVKNDAPPESGRRIASADSVPVGSVDTPLFYHFFTNAASSQSPAEPADRSHLLALLKPL